MNGQQPRSRALLPGLAAGIALGAADWIWSGLFQTPLPLVLASVLGGALAGLVLGSLAAVLRRPALGPALLLAGAIALEGLSAASKHLTGFNQGLGAAVALLFALVGGVVLARESLALGYGERIGALMVLPAGSWLGATVSRDPWMLVASCAAPLLWIGVLQLRARARGTRALAWTTLAVVGVVVQVEDEAAPRHRPPPGPDVAVAGPDIVLLVIDTLRADALDPGGSLAAFGRDGVVFRRCESVAPWTLPAVSSLLTGLYPSQHGAVTAVSPLALEVDTLAERLHASGYATAAFTGGAFVGSAYQLDQGFDVFDSTREHRFPLFGARVPLAWRLAKNRFMPLHWLVRRVDESVGLAGVTGAARDWVAHAGPRPKFVLLHTYQVHDYYIYDPDVDDRVLETLPGVSSQFEGRLSVQPSELLRASQEDLDHFRALYEGRVRAVESFFPELRAELAPYLGEDAIWIVTADHGEGFDAGLRRVHHGGRLHEDLLHVPLLMQAPGRLAAGRVVDELVRTIDVLPTVLELAGVPVPDGLAGQSLVQALAGTTPFPRSGFAEEHAHGYDLLSLQRDGWKWIRAPGRKELFHLPDDPEERHPLSIPPPAEMKDELLDFDEQYPPRAKGRIDIDPATLEQLKALGYVRD